MKFSEKLKNLRKQHNLTQGELAKKIFVTRTAISKWETDMGYPSIESLKQLSTLFNVSVDELLSDEDIKQKQQLEKTKNQTFYWFSMVAYIFAVAFAIAFLAAKIKYLLIGTYVFALIYFIGAGVYKFGKAYKPKQKIFIAVRLSLIAILTTLIFVIGFINL